jgi:hypothetical protein
MNVAGEPSTGNLYTRFDEGRGGQAYGLAPSSTLLKIIDKWAKIGITSSFLPQSADLLRQEV